MTARVIRINTGGRTKILVRNSAEDLLFDGEFDDFNSGMDFLAHRYPNAEVFMTIIGGTESSSEQTNKPQ